MLPEGFGQSAFWVPPLEEYLAFSMSVPDVADRFDENRDFLVVDALLRELGGSPRTPCRRRLLPMPMNP